MIIVKMRSEHEGQEAKNYLYSDGANSYTQDHWIYIIDDDGKILGCHPEMNVDAVLNKENILNGTT